MNNEEKERADIILREDNILELNRINGQSFSINLKQVYMIMVEKSENYMDILLNGLRNLHVPVEFYDGFIQAIQLSKIFEIHKQNYYTISKKLKDLPDNPNEITNDMYIDVKQHIDNLFLNLKSDKTLVVVEEPKYHEEDTEKIAIDVVDRGMVVFYKE